jgi:hypothetical protein
MKSLHILALFATCASAAVASQAAVASCKGGVCVSGYDSGKYHFVEVDRQSGFDYRYGLDGSEYYLDKGETTFKFRIAGRATVSYWVQPCNYNAKRVFTCGAKVNFTHTVK